MAYHSSDQSAPARSWRAVTPSDSVDLPAGCRGLYVTTGGTTLTLVGDDGVAVNFGAVGNSVFLPIGPVRVNSTGTDATGIIALY